MKLSMETETRCVETSVKKRQLRWLGQVQRTQDSRKSKAVTVLDSLRAKSLRLATRYLKGHGVERC